MEKRCNLVNNTSENRYEMEVEGQKAYIDYRTYPEIIELTYTYVPESCRGKQVGARLVEAVLEHVRAQRLKVIPRCGFVAQWIVRHPRVGGHCRDRDDQGVVRASHRAERPFGRPARCALRRRLFLYLAGSPVVSRYGDYRPALPCFATASMRAAISAGSSVPQTSFAMERR